MSVKAAGRVVHRRCMMIANLCVQQDNLQLEDLPSRKRYLRVIW